MDNTTESSEVKVERLLKHNPKRTLQSLATEIGISRERVRQIINKYHLYRYRTPHVPVQCMKCSNLARTSRKKRGMAERNGLCWKCYRSSLINHIQCYWCGIQFSLGRAAYNARTRRRTANTQGKFFHSKSCWGKYLAENFSPFVGRSRQMKNRGLVNHARQFISTVVKTVVKSIRNYLIPVSDNSRPFPTETQHNPPPAISKSQAAKRTRTRWTNTSSEERKAIMDTMRYRKELKRRERLGLFSSPMPITITMKSNAQSVGINKTQWVNMSNTSDESPVKQKDPQAIARGKARMAQLTPEQRSALASKASRAHWDRVKANKSADYQEVADRRGIAGRATMATWTPEQRSLNSSKAAKARWEKFYQQQQHEAAVERGRVGGLARAVALTPERRREIAQMGGMALWRARNKNNE